MMLKCHVDHHKVGTAHNLLVMENGDIYASIAGADSTGECGSFGQVPNLAARRGSHSPAACPEAAETSMVKGGGGGGGGRRKRVSPRWLEGYDLGH